MTAAPVRCNRCHRSVWVCPGGDDCATRGDDIHGAAPSCGPSAHRAAAIRKPSTLQWVAVSGGLLILSCPRCGEEVEMPTDEALELARPIEVLPRRRRRSTPITAVEAAKSTELIADEWNEQLRATRD